MLSCNFYIVFSLSVWFSAIYSAHISLPWLDGLSFWHVGRHMLTFQRFDVRFKYESYFSMLFLNRGGSFDSWSIQYTFIVDYKWSLLSQKIKKNVITHEMSPLIQECPFSLCYSRYPVSWSVIWWIFYRPVWWGMIASDIWSIIALWANHIVDPFLNYSDVLNYDLANAMWRVNVSGVKYVV